MGDAPPARPLLLVDVDGPLNPYAAKPHRRPRGYETHRFLTPRWKAAERERLTAYGLPDKRNNGNATNDITIKNGNGDCLGVMDDSESESAQVVAWSCDQNSDQDWSVQSNTGSTMVLVNERNPLNCLIASGGSTANGADAITWNCYDYTADQQWTSAVGDNAFADEQSLQN